MSKNKEHLEEMLKHLINKDEDKARLAFHQFIVDSARQIHESIVAEDELDAEIDEDVKSDFDDIKQEEYYGKEDLRDAEEMDSEDVSPDAAEDELMGDEETVDAEEDESEESEGEEGEEGEEIDREETEDAVDALAGLLDKFKAILGDDEDESADTDVDVDMEMSAETDESVEVPVEESEECSDEDMDKKDEEEKMEESVEEAEEVEEAASEDDEVVAEEEETVSEDDDVVSEDAFDFDLTEDDFLSLEESLMSVDVKMGGEQGGEKFAGTESNTKSPVAKKDMSDIPASGKGMMSKTKEHPGFDLEAAPDSDKMPHSGDNSHKKAKEGQSEVSAKKDGEVGSGKFADVKKSKSPIGS